MAAMEEKPRSLLPCIQSMLVPMFIMRVVVVAAMLLPVPIPSVLMVRWIVSDGKNNTDGRTNWALSALCSVAISASISLVAIKFFWSWLDRRCDVIYIGISHGVFASVAARR